MIEKKTECQCGAQFSGKLPEEYIKRNDADLKNFAYNDSVSMHFIYQIDLNGNEKSITSNGMPFKTIIHYINNELNIDSFDVDLDDGYYNILSVILPTKNFINSYLDLDINFTFEDIQKHIRNLGFTDIYNINRDCKNIIAFNTDLNQIEKLERIENSDNLEWNCIHPSEFSELELDCSTVSYEITNYFNYCHLYNCYINKAKDLLSKYSKCTDTFGSDKFICDDSIKNNKQDIQIRDYLWMAVNVIEYSLECNDYNKALRILNCVSQNCNSVCGNKNIQNNGCGCSKI